MIDIANLIASQQDLKKDAKTARDFEDFEEAVQCILIAVKNIEGLLPSLFSGNNEKAKNLAEEELADCYGILGGIYRRWAFKEPQGENKREKLKKSYASYDKGYQFELASGKQVSYNMLNRLVGRILFNPIWLEDDKTEIDLPLSLKKALADSLQKIEIQISHNREDIWAAADLGLNMLLLGQSNADNCFSTFVGMHPKESDYKSLLDTLNSLAPFLTDLEKNVQQAISYLMVASKQSR